MIKKILLFTTAFVAGLGIVFIYYQIVNFPAVKIKIPNFNNILQNSFFSLVKAPSKSLVGTVTSLSGDVEWQSRIATDSAKIFSPIQIQQGESVSTGLNGSMNISFPGSSEINIFPLSTIEFAQTLPADIVIAQTKGSVEYKKLSDVPLTVRALHLLVEGGGNFKVTIDDKKPVIEVFVETGSVTVAYNDINNLSKVVEIPADKILSFNDKTRKTVIK